MFKIMENQKPVNETVTTVHALGRCSQFLMALSIFLGAVVTTPNTQAQSTNGQDNKKTEEQREIERQLKKGVVVPLNNGRNGLGNPNQSCTIIITEQGILGAGIENLQMSSKILNGKSGAAQIITTNGSYSLSLDPSLGFSAAPANGSSNVNMASSFLGSGATNFSETNGNLSIRLKRGTTLVQTHLSATRTDSTPFPAGFYSAVTTLRCE